MASPKGLPSGAANSLAAPYRNLNLNLTGSPSGGSAGSSKGSASGQSQQGQSQTTNGSGITMTDENGQEVIDPKKAEAAGNKALADYQKAKNKLLSTNPEDQKNAEALIRSAINTRHAIWGYNDPVIPKMLEDLGALYARQDHIDTAISCYKSALMYITKQKGSGSYDRLAVMVKLGKLLRTKGEHREALNYLKQVALINERQNGKENPASLESRLDWAMEADHVGIAEADAAYRDCYHTMTHLDLTSQEVKDNAVVYDSLKDALASRFSDYLTRQGHKEEADQVLQTLKSLAIVKVESSAVESKTQEAH